MKINFLQRYVKHFPFCKFFVHFFCTLQKITRLASQLSTFDFQHSTLDSWPSTFNSSAASSKHKPFRKRVNFLRKIVQKLSTNFRKRQFLAHSPIHWFTHLCVFKKNSLYYIIKYYIYNAQNINTHFYVNLWKCENSQCHNIHNFTLSHIFVTCCLL